MDDLYGYISDVEKNSFTARIKRKGDTDLELNMKKKKLNLKQRPLLKLGAIVKINMKDKKLYFMESINNWV